MKTPEQQLVDLFHKFSVQRFNHPEFSRLLAESDQDTQRTFFLCMTSFIGYKAGFANNYPYEIDPDSLSAWCQELNDFIDEKLERLQLNSLDNLRPLI